MVQVCYNECLAAYTAVMVNDPDCGCGGDCEAGTVVESYCLRVVAGTGPAVTNPCLDAVLSSLKAGDVHTALCRTLRVVHVRSGRPLPDTGERDGRLGRNPPG